MMKQYDFLVALCLAVPLFSGGCAASPEKYEDDIGVSPSPALNANALNANALNANALNANALSGGALATGSLSADALSAVQHASATGDLSRQLLRYMVSCALDATQSVSFTWVDGDGVAHDETYPGLLALAPSWASGPLSSEGRGWVSACLISRVNYFGETVTLSSRGAHASLGTSASELAAYTMEEGAFWGDVFAEIPTAYACDHEPNDAHSRDSLRVCAAGYVDAPGSVQSCGLIQRLGSCDAACGQLSAEQYYTSCSVVSGQSSSSVITIFLE